MDERPVKRRRLPEETIKDDSHNASLDSDTTTEASAKEIMDYLGSRLNCTPEEASKFFKTQIEILQSKDRTHKATADGSSKYISGNESITLLEDLLNTILPNSTNGDTATRIKLNTVESASRSIHYDSNTAITDMLTTDTEGNTYNFNLQRAMSGEFLNHMLFYSYVQISRSLGEAYEGIKTHTVLVLSTKPWNTNSGYNFDIISHWSHKMITNTNVKSTCFDIVLCDGALQAEEISNQLKDWICPPSNSQVPTNSSNQHSIDAADKLDEYFAKNYSQIKDALSCLKHSRTTPDSLLRALKEAIEHVHQKRANKRQRTEMEKVKK